MFECLPYLMYSPGELILFHDINYHLYANKSNIYLQPQRVL